MTVPVHVLAAVRSIPHPTIPHPRQEPDMTAPHPSPAEQAVIDRFGIFDAEEQQQRKAALKAYIAERAAVWETEFAAGPGLVVSLDDAAHVAAKYVDKRAAEELRAAAHRLDDGGDEAIEVALGGAPYVHRVLCDRAHALDGKP